MEKREIQAPAITLGSMEKLVDKMYISNVAKRLRELNQPTDVDRKRWIWELIQNAKDTIASDPNRTSLNVKIIINGDEVKFRHDGNPFTSDTRFGLLYKYSEDKQTQESTGRFGTGFLTTHCLSKVVTIESDMYNDVEQTSCCGFEVTMYRDGTTEAELLEGLQKMRDSQKWFADPFGWTTFTYHVASDSGRKAIALGVENFKENIAKTMLFCKELASVELYYNGERTRVVRKSSYNVTPEILCTELDIESSVADTQCLRFLVASYSSYSKELTDKYKTSRDIRIDAAIEVDKDNCIISHSGQTTCFCSLPLVGIETQLNEPIIINSPDFEPDSERQSLMLNGQSRDEEKDLITEVGINRLIYEQVFPLYDRLVAYLCNEHFGKLYILADGLKKAKEHKQLDAKWYEENVLGNYRRILSKYPVVQSSEDGLYKLLSECVVVKETKQSDEDAVLTMLSDLYPDKLLQDNHEWAQRLWKDSAEIWCIDDLCKNIEEKGNWNEICLREGVVLAEWYNKFLSYVYNRNELLLKKYALLPNMNGDLLKKDAEDFCQGENVTTFVVDLLSHLGKDVKPYLLHKDVTAVELEAKYNSNSFSADVNRLAKQIIEEDDDKLQTLLPLLAIVPNDEDRYGADFIRKRKNYFEISKSLFVLTGCDECIDNSLVKAAWEAFDQWLIVHILTSLDEIGSLHNLPEGLDAEWLNEALTRLSVNVNWLNHHKKAVLPNQYGTFCLQEDLYKDAGIPEELKAEELKRVDIDYRKCLLHPDIDAGTFAISQQKNISDVAKSIKDRIEPTNNHCAGNYFNGAYHKYSQEDIEQVSLYMLSLLPESRTSLRYETQSVLLRISREILNDCEIQAECYIDYDDADLWMPTDFIVVSLISNVIKNAETIDNLNELLGSCGETHIFELLNDFYKVLRECNINYDALRIFPNQNGMFCCVKDLREEDGTIDDVLKDIVRLLVEEEKDYRNLLKDKRCHIEIDRKLSENDAYTLIDEKMLDAFNAPRMWEDAKVIEAAHLLVEVWGEMHKAVFENKFPRIYPVKDSMLVNIVWSKEKRASMAKISEAYSEDEKRILIDESEKIRELLDKLKEDEKVSIEVQLQSAGGSLVYEKIEVPRFGGLSKEEIKAYVKEAKQAVINYLKEINEQNNLELRFDEDRIAMDSYTRLYGVYDKNGREIPMIVRSYKGIQYRYFELLQYELDLLEERGAMLWVYTASGVQCLPLYALPIRGYSVTLDGKRDKCTLAKLRLLASSTETYANVRFDFGNNLPRGFKDLIPFYAQPDVLREGASSIRSICDSVAPALSGVFNLNNVLPLKNGNESITCADFDAQLFGDSGQSTDVIATGGDAEDLL